MHSLSIAILHGFTVIAVTCLQKRDSNVANQISQFRSLVTPQIYPNHSFVHKFILDNHYVYQWLEESDFNLQNAITIFTKHLEWRKLEKIDQIHLENWDYYQTEYPQFINLSNKTKDLIAEVWLSDWNIRKAVVSGQAKNLARWATYLVEMAQRKFSEMRLEARSTNTSYKAIEIIDVDGFNVWQHGCVSCMNVIIGIGQLCEKQYPWLWRNVYMINGGAVFRQFMVTMGRSSKTMAKGVLKLYTRKHEWMPLFDKQIGKSQRSYRFGGYLRDGSENE